MTDTTKDRRTAKRRTSAKPAVATTVVLVIVLAVVWAAVYIRDRQEGAASSRQQIGDEIQSRLDSMEWVTADFLSVNQYSRPGIRLEAVNSIVIHFIGNPDTTAAANRNYFQNLSVTGETHASSNFIICLDGSIVQCVPVNEIAYASNNRNSDTLSIELCHPDETGRFTDRTYASAVRLTAWLCDQYKLTSEDVIRHHDVTGKLCPRYFVDNEDAWESFKADIAQAMEEIRATVPN